MVSPQRRAMRAALFTLATVFTLAACSKSNGGVTPPAPTPTPANSVSFTVNATGTAVTLPTAYNLNGTVSFPAATKGAGTTLTIAETGGSPPAGLPNLNAPNIPVLFFSFNDASDVTFSGFPALTVVFPSGYNIASSTFYLAFYDPKNPSAGWQTNFGGPATVSGQSVNFSASTTALAMTGGQTYNFAVYALQSGPTPTPPPNTQYIFASNHGAASRNTIDVFPSMSNGNVIPVNTIADASGPNGLAVGANGTLYAANQSASISEFSVNSAGAGTLAATITGAALVAPQYIALDSNNNIYVTQSAATGGGADNVLLFAAAASGVSTPAAVIAGPATGLNTPAGIAVSGGVVYVANTAGNSVTEYTAGANGNAAPIVTIAGAATNLSGPTGLAVDAAGNIYVANTNNSLTVFAKGASGNVAPTATISGSSTLLSAPAGLWSDALGRILVANQGGNSLLAFPNAATGNAFPSQTVSGSATGLAAPFGITSR